MSSDPGKPCPCTADERATFLGWVGQLVHEHRLHLAGVARREGLGPEDAFDAVQEAFHAFLTLPAARTLVDARDDARNLLIVLVRANRATFPAVQRYTRPQLARTGAGARKQGSRAGQLALIAVAKPQPDTSLDSDRVTPIET